MRSRKPGRCFFNGATLASLQIEKHFLPAVPSTMMASARTLRLASSFTKRLPSELTHRPYSAAAVWLNCQPMPMPFSRGLVHGPHWIQSS